MTLATEAPSRVLLAWQDLTVGMSQSSAALVLTSIQTAINRGRYLDELQDAARNISIAVDALEHDHEPLRGTADPCARCKAEARESQILCALDGVRALLRNGGRA